MKIKNKALLIMLIASAPSFAQLEKEVVSKENIILEEEQKQEILIEATAIGFTLIQKSKDGKIKVKLEILGKITDKNKEKAIKVSEHILEKKPKYLSEEIISIDEKNKIEKEILEKLKKDNNNLKLEEESSKYYKENCLLNQKLYKGNGETVREYLEDIRIKSFVISEDSLAVPLGIAGAGIAGIVAITSNDDSSGSSSEKKEPSVPWTPIEPSIPLEGKIWMDGVEQRVVEYTNPKGITIATTENNYGLAASGVDAKITNEGEIVVVSDRGKTPTSNKDYFNTDTGRIEEGQIAGYAFGMVGDDSAVVTNNGTITTNAGGMALLNGAQGTNNGTIISTGEIGIYANGIGTMVANNGIITVIGASDVYGMYVDGTRSTAINNGSLTVTGTTFVYGMVAINGGTTENTSTGVIDVTGTINVYGMGVDGVRSTAINNGIITATSTGVGDVYGICVDGTRSTAINNGVITVTGSNAHGMCVYEVGTTAINNGIITATGPTIIYGMYAINGGTIENGLTGTIMVTGAGTSAKYGMLASSGATATNNGSITVTGSGTGGIYGMYTSGIGSRAINNGTINLTDASNGAVGISVSNGAYAINSSTGVINLDGINQTGIKADGVRTTFYNEGTINSHGVAMTPGTPIGDGAYGEDITYNNTAIEVTNGAQFINGGTMTFDEFNSGDITSDGSATFVMADGGTLSANSVSGDIYVSANIINGYDNKGVEEGAIETTDMNGNIKSDSIMYDASYKEGETPNLYDLVMERNSFTEIMDNQERAEMMESSYYSNGNHYRDDIFNEYKKAKTNDELDNLVSKTLGEDIYPSIQKLTYDIKDFNNDTLLNNVFNNIESDVEIRYIGGGALSSSSSNSSNSIQGSDTVLSSVYLGIDKKYNSNTRYGVIGTVGKGNTEYDDNSEISSDFYQLNLYTTHINDGYEYILSPYAGITKGDLDRKIEIGSIKDDTNADADSKYIGIIGQVSKNYKFDIKNIEFYAKPKVFIDTAVVMLDEISEGSEYGVTTEKNKSTSFITGVGTTVGKEFKLKNGSKVDTSVLAAYKHEFGNPTAKLEGNAKALEGNVEYNEYKQNKDYGDMGIRIAYLKGDLTAHVEYKYEVGQNDDKQKISIGLGYKF